MHRTGWRAVVVPGFRHRRPFHPLVLETCPHCTRVFRVVSGKAVPSPGWFIQERMRLPIQKNRLAKCRRGCSYDDEALLIRRHYLCSAAASRSSPVFDLPDAWHTASVPTRCRLAPQKPWFSTPHAAVFGIRFFIGRCAMGRQAFRLEIESVPLRKNTDRRSYGDRRKTRARIYFLNGGKERRSWKERRYIWDMTR